MRSGLEIQAALSKFVAKWGGYSGSEKAEAQTFLNELFACYGSDRGEAGAKFEHFTASAGFIIFSLTAQSLLRDGSANFRDVVRPYLTASDIADRPEQ